MNSDISLSSLSIPTYLSLSFFDDRDSFSPSSLDYNQNSINNEHDCLRLSPDSSPIHSGDCAPTNGPSQRYLSLSTATSTQPISTITAPAIRSKRSHDLDALDAQIESRLLKQQKIDRNRRAKEAMLFNQIHQLLGNDSHSNLSAKAPNRVQTLERVVMKLQQIKQSERIPQQADISDIDRSVNSPHTLTTTSIYNPMHTFVNSIMKETEKFVVDFTRTIQSDTNINGKNHQARFSPSYRSYMESLELNRTLYSTFFFSHRSILFLIDIQSGKLIDVNDQFRSRLGLQKLDWWNDGAALHPCLSTSPVTSLCPSLSVCSSSSLCSDHNIINHHIIDNTNNNNFITLIKFEGEDDHCWTRLLQPLNLAELYNGSKALMQCYFAMKNASNEWIEGEMKYWLESSRSMSNRFLVFECWERDSKQSTSPNRLHHCDSHAI